MGKEIERKFLVDTALWTPPAEGVKMVQAYLVRADRMTLRVRIAGERAYLTIKGPTNGLSRSEFEYSIPPEDAKLMLLEFGGGQSIVKTRYINEYAGHRWEIDVFDGENAGLVMAEVELENEAEAVELPPWAIREVSGDPRYYNSMLLKYPWRSWPENQLDQ